MSILLFIIHAKLYGGHVVTINVNKPFGNILYEQRITIFFTSPPKNKTSLQKKHYWCLQKHVRQFVVTDWPSNYWETRLRAWYIVRHVYWPTWLSYLICPFLIANHKSLDISRPTPRRQKLCHNIIYLCVHFLHSSDIGWICRKAERLLGYILLLDKHKESARRA